MRACSDAARSLSVHARQSLSFSLNSIRQSGAQLFTRVVCFPFTPARESLAQVFSAQLDEVTQQPHQCRYLILLLVLSRVDDVFAQTLDPYIAIVQTTQRALYARDALCIT